MDENIQKQTNYPLTFQRQPEEFLAELGRYLQTMQEVYRKQMSNEELLIWRETLKDFSFQEIDRALSYLVAHPPRYEVDGQIQLWTGLPKLPDVLLQIAKFQRDDEELAIKDYQERERREREQKDKAFAAYAANHPEEYEPFNVWQFLHEEITNRKKQADEIPLGPLPEEIRREELKKQFAAHQAERNS